MLWFFQETFFACKAYVWMSPFKNQTILPCILANSVKQWIKPYNSFLNWLSVLLSTGANHSDKSQIWKCAYLCLNMVEIDYYIVSFSTALLAFLFPCKAPLLSALFCQNGRLDVPHFVQRTIFVVFEFLNMTTVIVGAGYHAVATLVPCLCFLSTELKRLDDFSQGISDYRKLQVLEKIVNSVIRERIFAIYGYFLPFAQLIFCFVAIKICHVPEASIMRAAMFIAAYIGLLTVSMTTFSMAGFVIRFSTKWIMGFKKISKSPVTKRICRSLTPLRVQFGNNFVEPMTPLVIQEFCIRQTTTLLLLSK